MPHAAAMASCAGALFGDWFMTCYCAVMALLFLLLSFGDYYL